jgi:hypothetical protein
VLVEKSNFHSLVDFYASFLLSLGHELTSRTVILDTHCGGPFSSEIQMKDLDLALSTFFSLVRDDLPFFL